jgi:acyl dehydratase
MAEKQSVITNEMIERTRSRVGKIFVPHEPGFNTVATKDAIRHFVHGIGDPNPLWLDEVYATKTRYSSIVAPPTFLYSVYSPNAKGACFPGIHGWLGGNEWEFYKPILMGDSFTVRDTITGLEEKKASRMAKRTFIAACETLFFNQNGEVVARGKGWNIFAERGAARNSGKYSQIQVPVYSEVELKNIEESYDREEIRGRDPRFWEDVEELHELTPVVKGPLSREDILCWLIGAGGVYFRAHKFALMYRRLHPRLPMASGCNPEAVHFDNAAAQEVGVKYCYDYGSQRISWFGHLITNWIGDDGFLKRLNVKLTALNNIGHTTWCKGRIKRKHLEDNEPAVDIELSGENQWGQVTAVGLATVILPARNPQYWPLDKKL